MNTKLFNRYVRCLEKLIHYEGDMLSIFDRKVLMYRVLEDEFSLDDKIRLIMEVPNMAKDLEDFINNN